MIDLFIGDSHIPAFDPDYFTESERISKEETTEPDMGDRELREAVLKKRQAPKPQVQTEQNIPIRKKFEDEKKEKIKSPFLRLLKAIENGEAKITDELPYTEDELWKILEKENEYLNHF